jgi:hypothetical protein
VAPVKPEVAKAPEPAPSPKPVEPEQIKVVSVTKVSPDANVVFVPTPDASH